EWGGFGLWPVVEQPHAGPRDGLKRRPSDTERTVGGSLENGTQRMMRAHQALAVTSFAIKVARKSFRDKARSSGMANGVFQRKHARERLESIEADMKTLEILKFTIREAIGRRGSVPVVLALMQSPFDSLDAWSSNSGRGRTSCWKHRRNPR